jgi:hypothetical protein
MILIDEGELKILKPEIHLNNISNFSHYLTENIMHLHYEDKIGYHRLGK